MATNLELEDLLIKLRSKLNDDKIKLWEPPYYQTDNAISQNLQDLAKKYAPQVAKDEETVVQALHQLQLHSIDRSKANAEFRETGVATLRVKATLSGQKSQVLKVQKKLNVMGSELIGAVACGLSVSESRVKLIFNGKVLKPTPTIEQQGIRNGAQLMALVLAETPENLKKEDTMYMEMKATRDDALLLSECTDDLDGDDDYIKLEDQSGAAVELPGSERRALLVALALQQRGRAALRRGDPALALVLLLEADNHYSECSSGIVSRVDNRAELQLDVAWSLVVLGAPAPALAELPARLDAARAALCNTYPDPRGASERVLFARLHLLQGIVAFHQNQRDEARSLLHMAEVELGALRVDQSSLCALQELGWSSGQARTALRNAGGDVTAALHLLEQQQAERSRLREQYRAERRLRSLGTCSDGSPVSAPLVAALVRLGNGRRSAVRALRQANNQLADALRILRDQPHSVADSDGGSSDEDSPSQESLLQPDDGLLAQLVSMGYEESAARTALGVCGNQLNTAVEILLAGATEVAAVPGEAPSSSAGGGAPSSSTGGGARGHGNIGRKREREEALKRLKKAIKYEDEDDNFDSSLTQEEEFLARYKSLL